MAQLYSRLSDESDQGASTTATHIRNILQFILFFNDSSCYNQIVRTVRLVPLDKL